MSDECREAWKKYWFGNQANVLASLEEFEQAKSAFEAAWNTRASPPASADWRPIESAPKDGTRFLAVHGDAESVTTMILHWINAYDAFCDDEGIPHTAFTDWQPLPPPPSE